MLVSIIIPNYNGAKFLSECIDSCLNQGDSVSEIIIVDDNSTDESIELLKTYATSYPKRVFCFTNPGKGACAARNFGFSKATGDFIQFLDSDDVLGENKIEMQLHQLLASGDYKNKIIHGRWGRFFERTDEHIDWGPHITLMKNLTPLEWLTIDHMSMTGCWLTHRSLIEKGGGWNENLLKNQDGEFFSRIMTFTNEVLYNDEAKVYYRSGNMGSVSQTISRAAAASFLDSIKLIEGYTFSLGMSAATKLTIANKYQYYAYSNYARFPDLADAAAQRASDLGGYTIELPGGKGLWVISKIFGWRQALKIKRIFANY